MSVAHTSRLRIEKHAGPHRTALALGAGLALVQDLLVLLDGDIEVESEVGRGTRLVFRIPVEPL